MKPVIAVYKPVGITPLEALQRFKQKHPSYMSKKMSYPGRLDPMAEGVLVLLIGEATKKMVSFMKQDKEYVADILIGLSTDTLDILGMPTGIGDKKEIDRQALKKKIKSFKGNYQQKIPAYSSIRVKGKPLFYYARHDRLNEIEIPMMNVKIYDIDILDVYTISTQRLLKDVVKKISFLSGDFRQEEIIGAWKKLLDGREEKFTVAQVRINCSSGTYIRAIARDVGKEFGGGMLIGLKRTRVGNVGVRECERV
ncbi:MAG: hypothetical protein AABX16_04755 [Nanoarchaeota archaeon]